MNNYASETFSTDEEDVLRRYFTNLDQPVFALVNLPEVVKGALFARYSRTHKSLRRLFLDEFVDDLDISGDHSIDATVGLAKAEELYQRVFVEYGDDSVAQLGGVHLPRSRIFVRKKQNRDKFEKNKEFSNKISQGYRKLAKKKRWKIVNASQSKNDVHNDVMKIVAKKMGL